MSEKKSYKIDGWNLGSRIMEMVLREGKTSGVIAAILTKEGFKLSQPTVSRYIKEHRKNIEPEVGEMVRDHVRKAIPDDLDAVESMEKRALGWGEEEPVTQAERIAAWQKVLDVVEGEWIDRLYKARDLAEKDRREAVKGFVAQCLLWIIEDLDNKKGRMAAMKLAAAMIELKLKYAGVIDGAGKGNIFIEGDEPPDKEPDREGKPDKDKGEYKLSLVGGAS